MENMNALEVAACILHSFAEDSKPVTNLKLQKLVYYSQAWFLAIHEQPLFLERIEAWVHGPVTPSVFQRFKSFKWNPISERPEVPAMPELVSDHIAEVLQIYGDFSAAQLEGMTHAELPWREARGQLPPDASSNTAISCDTMRKFYAARLDG